MAAHLGAWHRRLSMMRSSETSASDMSFTRFEASQSSDPLFFFLFVTADRSIEGSGTALKVLSLDTFSFAMYLTTEGLTGTRTTSYDT